MERIGDQIDETAPGSETDDHDGVETQLTIGDTLLDRGVDDALDEGYSPPDNEPRVHVPTEAEELRGASLEELLAAEEPDVWATAADEDAAGLYDERGDEVGDARAGRLVGTGQGDLLDVEDELLADDVGIDGAAASAEEAAVHVIDEYDER